MRKTVVIPILALCLNPNLTHANKLDATAAAELAETIIDKLSDLPEMKCLNIALSRDDISHAVIHNIANGSVPSLYTIDRSVCKKIGGASSSDIEQFSISIINGFNSSKLDVKALDKVCCSTPVIIKQ